MTNLFVIIVFIIGIGAIAGFARSKLKSDEARREPVQGEGGAGKEQKD